MKYLSILIFTISFNISNAQDFIDEELLGFTNAYTLGDFDNDGDMDIFGYWKMFSNTRANLYINNSRSSRIELDIEIFENEFGAFGTPGAVDLDNDGDLDIVVTKEEANLYALINDGTASFTEVNLNVSGSYAYRFADLEGDGDMDIFGINAGDNSIRLFVNNGSLEFLSVIIKDDISRLSDIEVGDFDNDGDMDLVYSMNPFADDLILLLENTGNHNFTEKVILNELDNTVNDLALADMNKDGQIDIVEVSDQKTRIWLGQGDLEFSPITVNNEEFSHVVVLDLDGNLDLDLYVSNPDNGLFWLKNLSISNMEFETKMISPISPTFALGGADFNSNGAIDLLGSNTIFYLFQNMVPQSPPTKTRELSKDMFSIFPNPTSSSINLIEKNASHLAYTLYSMEGRILKSGYSGNIDLSEYADGLYFLDILDLASGDRRFEKIVKK